HRRFLTPSASHRRHIPEYRTDTEDQPQAKRSTCQAMQAMPLDKLLFLNVDELELLQCNHYYHKYLRSSILRGKRADFVGTILRTAKTIPFTPYSEGINLDVCFDVLGFSVMNDPD
ncbi:hypothetical protein SO802_018065, partial [Lithocarpus litseifolius]